MFSRAVNRSPRLYDYIKTTFRKNMLTRIKKWPQIAQDGVPSLVMFQVCDLKQLYI